MICINLRVVVYPTSFCLASSSCTSRTVADSLLHKTCKISSSLSVGLIYFVTGITSFFSIYDVFRNKPLKQSKKISTIKIAGGVKWLLSLGHKKSPGVETSGLRYLDLISSKIKNSYFL